MKNTIDIVKKEAGPLDFSNYTTISTIDCTDDFTSLPIEDGIETTTVYASGEFPQLDNNKWIK